MLHLLAVLNPIEVVEGRGFRIENAFAIAVVLVEAVRRPVLRDLTPLTAEHDLIEVIFHE
jgi:hypothetical protein